MQGVARLLGIAEQHGGVGLVENRVVDSRVSNTQRPFHHNHLDGRDFSQTYRSDELVIMREHKNGNLWKDFFEK